MYACEVWGAYTTLPSKCLLSDSICGYFKFEYEKLYIGFLKQCVGVHRKASNIAVLGELGQLPISLKILRLVCKNWFRIVNLPPDSLLYDAYLCNMTMFSEGKSTWLQTISDTIHGINLQHLWDNCGNRSGHFPDKILKKRFKTKFLDQWKNELRINGDQDKKLRNYVRFKSEFRFENYIHIVKDFTIRKNITRLRISAHNLAIEKGRHKRPTKVPLEQRLCENCNVLEDEFHFVIGCKKFKEPRQKMLNSIQEIFGDFHIYSEWEKFLFIMNSLDYEVIRNFSVFIKAAIDIRGQLL